jgi:hypothetical protein
MEQHAVPFRWDITKRDQLGHLVSSEEVALCPEFFEELRDCSARVLAFAGDSDLVFLGRSPESLFDYLSGIFQNTCWVDRIMLLQFSLYSDDPYHLAGTRPKDLTALYGYFKELQLDPTSLIHRPRPVTFVDIVDRGGTFGSLVKVIEIWTRERRLDWTAIQSKMRFVGITERTKTSPKTWRWQQHQAWVKTLPQAKIKNVSISKWFWDYLAATQDKVTPSHVPDRWGLEEITEPDREEKRMAALRFAAALFDAGRSRDERGRFAGELTRQREMREQWMRDLVAELRHLSAR